MATINASVVASSIAASLDGDNVAVSVATPSVQVAVSPQPVLAAAGSTNSIGPVSVSVSASPGEAAMTWSDLVTRWDVAPSQTATIAAGGVFAYTLDGVTRYRLVPSPYAPSSDAFYATFSGGVLSNLLVTRG